MMGARINLGQRSAADNEDPLAGAEFKFGEELECARLPRLQRLETSTPNTAY
jgi:hypothetical protein